MQGGAKKQLVSWLNNKPTYLVGYHKSNIGFGEWIPLVNMGGFLSYRATPNHSSHGWSWRHALGYPWWRLGSPHDLGIPWTLKSMRFASKVKKNTSDGLKPWKYAGFAAVGTHNWCAFLFFSCIWLTSTWNIVPTRQCHDFVTRESMVNSSGGSDVYWWQW